MWSLNNNMTFAPNYDRVSSSKITIPLKKKKARKARQHIKKNLSEGFKDFPR